MSNDPKDSPEYLLGQIDTKVQFLFDAEKARQETDKALDQRVTSLEHTRFKLFTIVSTVAAAVGFVFSNLKDGAEWLMSKLA